MLENGDCVWVKWSCRLFLFPRVQLQAQHKLITAPTIQRAIKLPKKGRVHGHENVSVDFSFTSNLEGVHKSKIASARPTQLAANCTLNIYILILIWTSCYELKSIASPILWGIAIPTGPRGGSRIFVMGMWSHPFSLSSLPLPTAAKGVGSAVNSPTAKRNFMHSRVKYGLFRRAFIPLHYRCYCCTVGSLQDNATSRHAQVCITSQHSRHDACQTRPGKGDAAWPRTCCSRETGKLRKLD